MAKSKKKFYVVWVGHEPGVYNTWADCQLQIKNYPNAKYKSFPSLLEANEAYSGSSSDFIGKKPAKPKLTEAQKALHGSPIEESLSVDAACSGNPGVLEYQGVDTKTGILFFHQGPFPQGTVNLGEFLALVHGIAFLQKQGKPNLPIYTDSRTAMAWVRKKKVNTQLRRNSINRQLFDLVDRAEAWIIRNSYDNPILKWKTEYWGEIPADFGRK